MNRMKKEEIKKRKEFVADLNSKEREFLRKVESLRVIVSGFKSHLHNILFPEESDFMADDHVDADNRRRGINPMQEEYQIKVNKRRKKMGIKPLAENGMVKYNDSSQYTIDLMTRLITGKDIKVVIKNLSDVEFNYQRFVESMNTMDVTEFRAQQRKEMAELFGKKNV